MNKHMAMKKLVDLGDGIALTKLPMKAQPIGLSNKQLADALIEAEIIDSADIVDAMTPEQKNRWQTIFKAAAPQGPDVVSVMKDGKMTYYRVHDDLLLRSIKSLGHEQFDGLITKVFRVPKKVLTAAVTADPAFMLANFARDTLASFVVSNAKLVPLASAVKGFKDTMAEDPLLFRIMAAGGGGGGFYQQERENLRTLLSQKMPSNKVNSYLKTMVTPTSGNGMWQLLQRVGSASEMANRMAIARDVLAKGGGLGEASYQAQDLLNFSMAGDWQAMKFLTSTVPFMNARIQGLYRLYRGGRDNPIAFAMKGMLVAGASLALYYKNEDDDRYQELEQWDRDANWHFFIGGDHYRLPKPFEVGAIFGTIPERMAQVHGGHEDQRIFWRRMGAMVLETFALNPVPQALKPVAEQYMNKSFFLGYPIVNQSMENKPEEMQFNYMTSATFREMAKAMPDIAPAWLRSPKRLEAMWRGYTGSIGMYALSAADGMTRDLAGYPDRPVMKLWDRPIAKRFVRDPVPYTSVYQEQLYEMLTEANQMHRAIKDLVAVGDVGEAREIHAENREKLAARKGLGKVARQVSGINKKINAIYLDPRMSGEDKWARVQELKKRKVKSLRQVARYADRF
jgi:hypothetical protein